MWKCVCWFDRRQSRLIQLFSDLCNSELVEENLAAPLPILGDTARILYAQLRTIFSIESAISRYFPLSCHGDLLVVHKPLMDCERLGATQAKALFAGVCVLAPNNCGRKLLGYRCLDTVRGTRIEQEHAPFHT